MSKIKNVYTVTFQNSKSLGALLQTYALHKFLLDEGYNAKVINYIPPYFDEYNRLINLDGYNHLRIIKGLVKNILVLKNKVVYNKKFNFFRKRFITCSEEVRDIKDLEKLDIDSFFIAGSDQIWNNEITIKFDDILFMNKNNKNNTMAYAGSTGKIIKNDENDEFNLLLRNYRYLSIREKSTLNYLNDFNKRRAKVVCDPVFLLDREAWISTVKKNRFNFKYILLYQLDNNDVIKKMVYEFAEKSAFQVIEVWKYGCLKHGDNCYIPSPNELVEMIYYSERVVTNSFHGTCLSIILNKEMDIYINESRGNRLTDLLLSFNLESRVLENEINGDPIDYTFANKCLKELYYDSKDFILNGLTDYETN
ncbi:MAG: polysaccharide pyruvyl transferase family protein [Erysipelotrichaceae bacterium]